MKFNPQSGRPLAFPRGKDIIHKRPSTIFNLQSSILNRSYRSRFGRGMRVTAILVILTTGGLPFTLTAARGEHLHRVQTAREQAQQAALRSRLVHELKAGTTDKLTPAQWKEVDAKRAKEAAVREAHKPDVRLLSLKEMESAKGSGPYRNRYFAGTLPWHRSLRDVNLCNGNLFKSFTDVQVSPAKGAGLALQRTYNSQEDRPGPFGVGWTHAYDIRMEEENPTSNQTSDTLNVADRTDFFGAKHKYHRDCDGLYSPLPYCSILTAPTPVKGKINRAICANIRCTLHGYFFAFCLLPS